MTEIRDFQTQRQEAQKLPPARSPLEWVVVGPGGVRAGWRLLLFVFIAIVFALPLAIPARLFVPGKESTPVGILSADSLLFLAALCSALVMGRIEKRSLGQYALPARGTLGLQFWQGTAWGFAALTALLLAIKALGGFSFGALALAGPRLFYYAGLWLLAFLAVGLFEEFLMRGYVLYTLTTGIGFWPAAALLSVVFGVVHLRNPGENWVGASSATLIGVFFCFTVRRTGSLWFAIGMHTAWNYCASFLYGVPNSGVKVVGHLLNSSFDGPGWLTGGSVGPEGSVLVFILIAVLFVLFQRMYRQVRFPLVSEPVSAPAAEIPRSQQAT